MRFGKKLEIDTLWQDCYQSGHESMVNFVESYQPSNRASVRSSPNDGLSIQLQKRKRTPASHPT